MNHLAHAFLAADSAASIIGNLSGDFVRGPLDSQFDPDIADGIRLHRKVDSFTDAHAVTRRSRKRFVGAQRRVSGIVVDVYFDHFLWQQWSLFSDELFADFCQRIYSVLQIHQSIAPLHFKNYIPRFIEHDLLASCTTLEGVSEVIERLAYRWERKSELQQLLLRAGNEARNYCDEMQDDFLAFFPELIREAEAFNQQSQAMYQS